MTQSGNVTDPSDVTAARAVFLDRDGVIVIPFFREGRSFAPRRLEELRCYPHTLQAIRLLKEAGFIVIVATNQPDVGAGLIERQTIEAMHERLLEELPIDDIEVCFDTREQAGPRRKPNPGMLIDAARKWRIDLSGSYMVGDRASDVEAGLRAGCLSVFVDHKYTAEQIPSGHRAAVRSLPEAVAWILARESTAGTAKFAAQGLIGGAP